MIWLGLATIGEGSGVTDLRPGTPRPTSFDLGRWNDMWATLDEGTQDAIRAKCEWEHMSRSAVVREWWPELWEIVTGDARV